MDSKRYLKSAFYQWEGIRIENYTAYHIHDDTSNCNGYADSCTNFKEYIKLAKECNMSALAFSNHGGVYNWILKKQECDKAGIKYIHGVEMYLCTTLPDNDRGGHIGLYAKNWEGVKEINSLVSISSSKGIKEDLSDRHMYFNYRISLEELMNTSDNIIVTTACIQSPLHEWDNEEKKEYYNKLVDWLRKNKHRCFLEIQYHNTDWQIDYNKKLYEIHKETGIPLIAGTDTHSSTKYKAECRKILQIYKNSFYGDEDECDLVWKSYDELIEKFKEQNSLHPDVYLKAIENTNVLANMVENFKLDKAFKYPTLYGDNARQIWMDLIYERFEYMRKNEQLKLPSVLISDCERFLNCHTISDESEKDEIDIYNQYQALYQWCKNNTDKDIITQYKKRIAEEFKVLCKLGMESFMMFMSELCSWCEENDIPRGNGRGSVCGSEIAYITGITDVDPMVWNTVFSRFCNEDRVSLGDIDIDFAPEDRDKVYRYIIERFTPQKTAYIAAFQTVKDRKCIDILAGGLGYKDLKKVAEIKDKFDKYNVEYTKVIQAEVNLEELVEDKLTETQSVDMVHHNLYMLRIANADAKRKVQKIKDDYDDVISQNQDLFYYFKGLLGTIESKGTHPSGIIGSPITLSDNIGLYYKEGDPNIPVSTCNMKAVDSLNYVKFDILGLKTVGVIKDACKYIGIPYPKSYSIDWRDLSVWRDMRNAQQGIFQFEGDYSFGLLNDFKPTTINHMSMVNAALRPSGKSYRDNLIAGVPNKNPSEEIDKLLKDNNGYLIFQEDTIKFLTDICDFSGSAADTTRRCISGDSMIMLGNGNQKKIKELTCNDSVMSLNELGVMEPKSVINVFNNGNKNVYSIKTQHGYELLATHNHKVFSQKGWVRIDELTTNDFLMVPKNINTLGDGLKPQERYTESTMFLIGMLIGDGSLGNPSNLHFTNHEIALIDKYKDCISKTLRTHNCEFLENKQRGVTVDYIYSVYIKTKKYKTRLIKILNECNLICMAGEKEIPNNIMSYPKGGKILNLLAGLFNTDGGYNYNQCYIEYYSTSKILTQQIQSLLLKYGIYSYIQVKPVSGYNYDSFSLMIRQSDSLNIFSKNILPLMIGEKKEQFSDVIRRANLRSVDVNYILPNECKNEILSMCKKTNKSVRSLGEHFDNKSDLGVHLCDFGIGDVKAKKIVQNMYCPYTYKMLFSDYLPVRIKEIIKDKYYTDTYDIEVEDNHNYVADNIIVHNCIGKKDKIELEKQLPKILDGYCNHSKKPRDIAEDEARQFVQIVQDSSEYQFGLNHSTAYSMNGFQCVSLRTHHTIEFIAAYLNRAENKDQTNNGIELAHIYGIKVEPIKFGKSGGEYTIDKENNRIYKGIASIKYCNNTIADEMHELSIRKQYTNFPVRL